jgi:hypothetical protein
MTATKSQEMDEAAEASLRIGRLLEEVRSSVSPMAAQRIDALVAAIVDVYGRAVERLVAAVAPERRALLADDEFLGSVLTLHGLHPHPPEMRARKALEELAPQLGRLELVAVGDGRARVRAYDAPAVAGAREMIVGRMQEVAPELERIDVDGLPEPARSGLVQIRVR